MRLLVIAYEFPPSPSPQSLRWAYLVRELATLGHEIHVLTADLGGETPGLPDIPDSVHVHRTFPGLLRGALAFHRTYRERHPKRGRPLTDSSTPPSGEGKQDAPLMTPLRPPRNWKQRLSEGVQAIAGYVHFPDIRGEWRAWGRKRLHQLAKEIAPDVVISSHEPATTLELGGILASRGSTWIADLGDPVLAPYTPARWKRKSRSVEAMTCRKAAHIIVTSSATRELLADRHGRTENVHVLTQGFDANPELPQLEVCFEPGRLELLYTGSLYAFRRIDDLLSALQSAPNVRLNIASVTVPERILQVARTMPSQVRLLGFMPHLTALALQRQAHVLVNIANADPTQIPGKFYEYLGACRPILHLGPMDDPVSGLIDDLRRGWVCRNEAEPLGTLLRKLSEAHDHGGLETGLELGREGINEFSWQVLAKRLHSEVLQPLARGAEHVE